MNTTNKKRVSILSIGNELLLGQIVNKNAAVLSERLLDYNLRVQYHLTVADNVNEIVSALEYLWDKSDIVFTCGGLGPTEDDLSREAIAHFLKVPLNQNDPLLKELKLKLQKRDVQFTLNHIKQAQFPDGSSVMKNDVGTADGFHVESGSKDIFAVPGPLAELNSCWDNYIDAKLTGVSLHKVHLERYKILGLPESEVSSQIKGLLDGSEFVAEYRMHQPYVEVRVDLPIGKASDWKVYDKKIHEVFEGFLVGKGSFDPAKEFVEKIKDQKVLFVDAASHGYLAERLLPLVKGLKFDFFQIASLPAAYSAENYDIFFDLRPVNETEWVGLVNNTKEVEVSRLTKRRMPQDLVRKKLAEIFLHKVLEQI